MDKRVEQLLEQSPHLWQASRGVSRPTALATGYAPLDRVLHGGGWAKGSSTELLLERHGIGEMRLLMPVLAQLSRSRWVILVAPPWIPYAPAWQYQGLDLSRLLWVRATLPREQLWAADQFLRLDNAGAVIVWEGSRPADQRDLRRLQQAAAEGGNLHFMLRQADRAHQVSPAATRLRLQSRERQLRLQLLKQRGGWAGQTVAIRLQPDYGSLHHLTPDQWPVTQTEGVTDRATDRQAYSESESQCCYSLAGDPDRGRNRSAGATPASSSRDG